MAVLTLRAYATVADVQDGAAGISVLASNENHTFVADTTGAITPTELAAYACDIEVLVGIAAYAFIPAGNLAAGQWKISTGADDGAAAIAAGGGLTAAVVDLGDTARITLANAPGADGFADGGAASPDSVQLVVPVQVRVGAVTRSFNRVLTLTKAKGGSARVLTVTADAHTLIFDGAGALKQPTEVIVFEAELVNIAATAGDVVWEYRIAAGAAWSAFPAGAGIVRSMAQETRLAVTRQALANLITGGAQHIAIRAMLDSRFDIVSVHRVQDGAAGAAGASAVEARITPRSSNVLFNNAGSVIFDAHLYYRGALADDAITAYQWLTITNNVDTNIAGADSSFRQFDALAIGSGGRLIACDIAYDDTHADVTG